MFPTFTAGERVTHANTCKSYGAGEITRVVPSFLRPPSKAFVRFDGERADRLVWLDDLTRCVTPAPMPGSREVARICWPPERAGQPVEPAGAA